MENNEALDIERLNRLTQDILSGNLTVAELVDKLTSLIETEYDKPIHQRDTQYIRACEDLLWSLEPLALPKPCPSKRLWQGLKRFVAKLIN